MVPQRLERIVIFPDKDSTSTRADPFPQTAECRDRRRRESVLVGNDDEKRPEKVAAESVAFGCCGRVSVMLPLVVAKS